MQLKIIFSFAIGLSAGSIASYFLTKNRIEKKALIECDEIREYYSARLKEAENYIHEKVDSVSVLDNEVDTKDISEDSGPNSDSIEKALTSFKNPDPPIDYSAIADRLNRGDYPEFKQPKEEVPTVPRNRSGGAIISPDEFLEENGYDKITLTYFEGDNTFVDIDEDPIDAMDSIGYSNLEHFGEFEANVLYVRNDIRNVDYEILKETGSYQEFITGEYEE